MAASNKWNFSGEEGPTQKKTPFFSDAFLTSVLAGLCAITVAAWIKPKPTIKVLVVSTDDGSTTVEAPV